MTKKILLGILGFLALCTLGVFVFVKDFEVKITEEVAQAALDQQIGAEPLRSLVTEIKLQTATIDFKTDNTMEIDTKFSAITLGYESQVEGVFKSGIRYRVPKIYLDNIAPMKVDIRTDDETAEELGEIKSAARKFLDRQRARNTGEGNRDTRDDTAKQHEKELQDKAVNAVYGLFEYVPIYDLTNAGYKGSVASLALKDVQFHEDYVAVTLSPRTAILRILAIIGVILLVLGYFAGQTLMSSWFERLFFGKRKTD